MFLFALTGKTRIVGDTHLRLLDSHRRSLDNTYTMRSLRRQYDYWSQVTISCSQVFFGILAATLFIGRLDLQKSFVLLSNLILTIIFWFIGWSFVRYGKSE